MENKTKGYVAYENARSQIYKLMDKYGADTTIDAIVDTLTDTVGDESLKMVKAALKASKESVKKTGDE